MLLNGHYLILSSIHIIIIPVMFFMMKWSNLESDITLAYYISEFPSLWKSSFIFDFHNFDRIL